MQRPDENIEGPYRPIVREPVTFNTPKIRGNIVKPKQDAKFDRKALQKAMKMGQETPLGWKNANEINFEEQIGRWTENNARRAQILSMEIYKITEQALGPEMAMEANGKITGFVENIGMNLLGQGNEAERRQIVQDNLIGFNRYQEDVVLRWQGAEGLAKFREARAHDEIEYASTLIVDAFENNKITREFIKRSGGPYWKSLEKMIGAVFAPRAGAYELKAELPVEQKKRWIENTVVLIDGIVEKVPEETQIRKLWLAVRHKVEPALSQALSWAIGCIRFLLGAFLIGFTIHKGYAMVSSWVTPDADLQATKEHMEQAHATSQNAEGRIEELQQGLEESKEKLNELAPEVDAAGNLIDEALDFEAPATPAALEASKERIRQELFSQAAREAADDTLTENRRNWGVKEREDILKKVDEVTTVEDGSLLAGAYESLALYLFGGRGVDLIRGIRGNLAELKTLIYKTVLDADLARSLQGDVTKMTSQAMGTLKSATEKYVLTKNDAPVYTAMFNTLSQISFGGQDMLGHGFMGIIEQLGLDTLRQTETFLTRFTKDMQHAFNMTDVTAFTKFGSIMRHLLQNGVYASLNILSNSWMAMFSTFIVTGAAKVITMINDCIELFIIELFAGLMGESTMGPEDWDSPYEMNFGYSKETKDRMRAAVAPVFNFINGNLMIAQDWFAKGVGALSILRQIGTLGYLLLQMIMWVFGSVFAAGWVTTIAMIAVIAGIIYLIKRLTGVNLVTWVANSYLKHPYLTGFGLAAVQLLSWGIIWKGGWVTFNAAEIALGEDVTARWASTPITEVHGLVKGISNNLMQTGSGSNAMEE